MKTDMEDELQSLHRDLGLKRLNPLWAKIEILGGLFAAGIGLSFLTGPVARKWAEPDAWLGVVLFVLGGYLAMAGHRSHLYQSNNALAAWLRRSLKDNCNGPSTFVGQSSSPKEQRIENGREPSQFGR